MILNEFCLNTGYHRKYAIRLRNGPPPGKQSRRAGRARRRGRSYGHQTLSILTAVWEAAGYPWSVRLKALLPIWMPWVRKRFAVRPEIEQQLLSISPRQIDRRLQANKTQRQRRIYGRTKPGHLLKHHIPVKTDSWDVTSPGFTEIDLVSHSGNSGEGEFAHSLNVTDIQTTWKESRAVLGRGQAAVEQALNEVDRALRSACSAWTRIRPGEAPHPALSARKSATQTAQKTALCAPASTTCKPHSSRGRGWPELGPSRLRDHGLG